MNDTLAQVNMKIIKQSLNYSIEVLIVEDERKTKRIKTKKTQRN